MRNRVQRHVHQVGAVHKGMDAGAFGQHFVVQLVNSSMHTLEHLRRILSAQHLHDTFYAVGVIAFAVVEAQYALAFQIAVFQFAYIIQVNGHSVLGLDDDASQVFQVFHQTDTTDYVAQFATTQHAAACIYVVHFHFLGHVSEGNAVFFHLMWVQFNLILRGDAAVVAYICHARHLFQAGDDDPLVQVGDFAQVQVFTVDDVAVYLSGGRGQRIQSRHGVIGQLYVYQTLLHTLACPVVVNSVIKYQHHGAQSEGVLASHHVQTRHAVHGTLDGDGDLLFYFLGCQSGHLGYNLYGGICNVGISVDGKPCPRIITHCRNEGKQYDHQSPTMYRQINKFLHTSCGV